MRSCLIFTALSLSMSLMASALGGCCTLFNGRTHDLELNSSIASTSYSVVNKDNKPVGSGTTPTQLHLKGKQAPYTVTFIAPTGERQNYVVKQGISKWMFANLILGGAIGFGIDAWSGALYTLKPESVNMDMVTGKNLALPSGS